MIFHLKNEILENECLFLCRSALYSLESFEEFSSKRLDLIYTPLSPNFTH